ncbi:hypothetical protein ACVIYH_007482 [Bradyrhizobium diazoefficiens]
MEKYHIKLTESEAAILAKVDLWESHRNHDEGHAAYKANAQPILTLLQSLSDRSAIPQERLNYWNDPRYHQGRIKASRKGLFERMVAEVPTFTRIHILSVIFDIFCLCADLPDDVIAAFEEKVGNPQWVSSSDVIPIGKDARDLTRQYRLDKTDAPEEFFKLCLDMGLSLTTAESVMRRSNKFDRIWTN